MKKINKAKYVIELVDNVTGRAYWAGDGDAYPTKRSAQALADKYPERYTAKAIKLAASSENPYAHPSIQSILNSKPKSSEAICKEINDRIEKYQDLKMPWQQEVINELIHLIEWINE